MAEADQAGARTEKVARLCAALGLAERPSRLEEALTHPSYANEQRDADVRDNQRLEFLGDAVLGLCVSEILMQAFGDVREGDLTVMRAALVNARALAAAAAKLELADTLLVGRGADATGERYRVNVLADAMEAIIGAVYLDGGLDAARAVTRRMLADAIDQLIAAGGIERDPKSRLQEHVQALGLPTPSYRVIAAEGPPHSRRFRVAVEVVSPTDPNDRIGAEGEGRSKKLAEQAAARDLLARLG